MEQLSIFDYMKKDWKEEIRDACTEIGKRENLPDGALRFAERESSGKTESYCVILREEPYPKFAGSSAPAKETTVLSFHIQHFASKESRFEVLVPESSFLSLGGIPSMEDLGKGKGTSLHRFACEESRIGEVTGHLKDYLSRLVRDLLPRYQSKGGPFACCSRYAECSDAGHCVHPNPLYSQACRYRKNLDAGRIFFGKKRNVTT